MSTELYLDECNKAVEPVYVLATWHPHPGQTRGPKGWNSNQGRWRVTGDYQCDSEKELRERFEKSDHERYLLNHKIPYTFVKLLTVHVIEQIQP